MFDATRVLGGFLQGRHGGSAGGIGGMVQQALTQFAGNRSGGAGTGVGGGLGALLNQFTGSSGARSAGGNGNPASGGFMDQVGDLARRAVEAPGAELRNNNPAAVGGAGALAGALLGGGRGAVGGGLLAVLGSLAYAAYHKQEASAAATASPWGQGAKPVLQAYTDPAEVQRKATLVLRAMIQATKADGQLDDAERDRLTRHLADSGDDAEARAFMEAEMAKPLDVAGLAAQARSPEEGAEIYAASLMAVTVDTQAERDYLAQLAEALRLPPDVVSHVQSSLKQVA